MGPKSKASLEGKKEGKRQTGKCHVTKRQKSVRQLQAKEHQQPPKAWGEAWNGCYPEAQRKRGPADTLILDFQLPEASSWERISFYCFSHKSVAVCYSSLRKRKQTHTLELDHLGSVPARPLARLSFSASLSLYFLISKMEITKHHISYDRF